ncbi:MAG: acyl-ACP desaturase [Deltaproteobacteria bacterium]|nr:acyl-ACP desaturase [Deltaproteobacteria bacterium]
MGHYIEYFGRAMKLRNWLPWHSFPLQEMRQWGHRLSAETVHLIEGFLGVEEYVADYVLEGLEMFRDNRTRRNLQLQWGAEEAKHGVSWELVLQHSLARTEEQLQTYLAKVRDARWSVQQHPGTDTPLGSTVYAMVQERATYFNYQAMQARIREEYGLPPTPTPEEQQRGYEVGAAEAFRVVGLDEIAHHGLFLQVIQSALKYFPSLTCDVLAKVFAGFEMPALRFIPNARAFLRAVRRTGFYSGSIHREKVHNPVLRALGLDGHEAFEKAVQLARTLPDHLGPDSFTLTRSGEWVVAGTPAPATS